MHAVTDWPPGARRPRSRSTAPGPISGLVPAGRRACLGCLLGELASASLLCVHPTDEVVRSARKAAGPVTRQEESIDRGCEQNKEKSQEKVVDCCCGPRSYSNTDGGRRGAPEHHTLGLERDASLASRTVPWAMGPPLHVPFGSRGQVERCAPWLGEVAGDRGHGRMRNHAPGWGLHATVFDSLLADEKLCVKHRRRCRASPRDPEMRALAESLGAETPKT
jgi:hypothetical protein